MAKDLVLLVLHGMGKTEDNYADPLKRCLKRRMGKSWNRVAFYPVRYDVLQMNQRAAWKSMRKDKKEKIDWKLVRKYLLYGFSDAAGLERKPHLDGRPYEQAQERIKKVLATGYRHTGSKLTPVVIVAHSLGGQVISNYIWDSQAKKANQGIWKKRNGQLKNVPKDPTEEQFLRLHSLKALFTTGCNIPIFVAGLPPNEIKAIRRGKGGEPYNFTWSNYYDRDDPLGWPLGPLSWSYKKTVNDFEINAGGAPWWEISVSWNPFSHTRYWSDDQFLTPLIQNLKKFLPKPS